jgi:hypothetical protein
VSALVDMYDEVIARGAGHREAVRELARRLDVDEPTIGRMLRRARKSVSATADTAGSFGPAGTRSNDQVRRVDPFLSLAAPGHPTTEED